MYKVFADSGRYLITHNKLDIGKFKIPTLRNVGITYPYMHNGSVKTLEEVLAHYAKGGMKTANKSKNIKGFELSKESERDLIAFLNSLTSKKYLEKEE
jgi:cytochrome c peroxidase